MVVTSSLERQQDRKLYTEYRDKAEQTNIEREKAGLLPKPIMPMKEWRATTR